jgi:anti-anti-sigma factor
VDIELASVEGVTVLEIRGRVDSLTAPSLGEKLMAAMVAPNTRLIADMSGVEYMSSAGLRVLLLAARHADETQGKLVLHGLNTRVGEVFDISGFSSILTVCVTRDQALALTAA